MQIQLIAEKLLKSWQFSWQCVSLFYCLCVQGIVLRFLVLTQYKSAVWCQNQVGSYSRDSNSCHSRAQLWLPHTPTPTSTLWLAGTRRQAGSLWGGLTFDGKTKRAVHCPGREDHHFYNDDRGERAGVLWLQGVVVWLRFLGRLQTFLLREDTERIL